jgi:hypothetical protein
MPIGEAGLLKNFTYSTALKIVKFSEYSINQTCPKKGERF